MKNIPGIEPIVNDIKQEAQTLTDQERIKKEKEEQELNKMVNTLYKPDYKMYIFKGDEMYNEEFLAALDNSPTYRRTAQDLERMMEIFGGEPAHYSTASGNEDAAEDCATEAATTAEEEEENVGETVFDKEFN